MRHDFRKKSLLTIFVDMSGWSRTRLLSTQFLLGPILTCELMDVNALLLFDVLGVFQMLITFSFQEARKSPSRPRGTG